MEMLDQLTGWDIMILVVALISAGMGMVEGMAKSIADLGSWVIALFGSFIVAPHITQMIGLEAYPWVGLILGFVLLFFITRLLGVWISKALRRLGLGGADRSLGAIIGLVRAAMIIALLASGGKLLEMDKQAGWQNAMSKPVLDTAADLVSKYAPKLEQFKPAAIRK